jgi:hypothetical protein
MEGNEVEGNKNSFYVVSFGVFRVLFSLHCVWITTEMSQGSSITEDK